MSGLPEDIAEQELTAMLPRYEFRPVCHDENCWPVLIGLAEAMPMTVEEGGAVARWVMEELMGWMQNDGMNGWVSKIKAAA
jgi:hypothetical protein